MASSESRLAFLDAARGIAAVTVVVQHAGESLWYRFANDTHVYFNPGRFGVLVFFLVSGFIIPASFERLRGERGMVTKQFWIGRFFRLYPLYWVSLAAILVIGAFSTEALSDEYRAHWVINSLANVTMLQELMGRPHAVGLYYTLTLEMLFYFACTGLFVVGLLHASVRNAWVVIVGASFAGCVLPLALDHRMPMAALFYACSMFIGTVVYRWSIGEARARDVGFLVGAVAVFGAIGSWVNYVHFTDWEGGVAPFSYIGATGAWVLAYAGFFALFAMRARPVPAVFTWLGRISYSVYLVHPLFVASLHHVEPPAVALGLIVAGTFVIAPLTYRFVEVPAQTIGRRVRRRVVAGG